MADTVVSIAGYHHARATCHRFGNAYRQIVGLTACASEHQTVQIAWKMRQQTLGIGQNTIVQITGVGAQSRGLRRHRRHHFRIAMANHRHVVIRIQITTALVIG